MGLKDVNIKLIYDSSNDNIEKDLFIPLMKESTNYYRGVGFFSSTWLEVALDGVENIIENKGKIYLITSPKISEQDYEAILRGNKAKSDEIIYNSIIDEINNIERENKKKILAYLSWLIAENYIEMKFAVCKNQIGMYHDKLAIFEDGNNDMVCIHGSLNDSLTATFNGEAVSVFKNWSVGKEYCSLHKDRFEKMWNNEDDFYYILDMPEKVKDTFENYSVNYSLYKKNKVVNRELRKYQEEAISNFFNNNYKGILDMATGTGKTITSISAMKKYFDMTNKQFLIVIVPFNHLVPQWRKELENMGYEHILECKDSRKLWENKLITRIKNFNSNWDNKICIITTYKTASTENFYTKITMLKENTCILADECHYLGSKEYSKVMLENIDVRLGLSATPNRWFDEEGTDRLIKYFDKIVYEYSLEKAIENGFLTKYRYYPQVVELDMNEQDEYKNLTLKISKMANEKDEKKEIFEALCRKRKNILSKANNKYELLLKLLFEQKEKGELNHTLIYCAKGESKKVVSLLKDLNLNVHEFVYDVNEKDRQLILSKFDKGEYQILVAIRCLDEGVDVPSTKVAYFLSSTSNPREFVQRRGRILRKFEGKEEAIIYDFIVFPNAYCDDYKIGKGIIKKELPRFAEFSSMALNKFEAINEIYDKVSMYNLENRLDMKPFEVYQEYIEERIEDEENKY